MEIAIIGTGNMARGIGTRAVAGGHTVNLIGKERQKAEELAAELGGDAGAADAVSGEVVVLAVYYPDALEAVRQHADEIDGKVVVDISNPVTEDYSGLVDRPAGSAAEEIAAAAPDGARVVKAFNTTFATTLVEGQVDGRPLDVFIAGDDEAKSKVRELVESGGLNAIDAGPLSSARYLEAAGFLHISVQGNLGTGFGSALKVLA